MTPLHRAARRTFRALRTRNFKLFFTGIGVSNAGTWLQTTAMVWLVLRLTGSGSALGITVALQFGPILVLGTWAGVIVDRLDKRRLLMLTAVLAGLQATVLAVLVLTGVVQAWMVYGLALGLGLIAAFDSPTRQAIVPELVPPEDLENAVGLSVVTLQLARVIGPAIAGFMIAGLGVESCFVLNALSFLAVIWAMRAMRVEELRPSVPIPRAAHQLRDGLAYAWRSPVIRLTLVMTAIMGTLAFNGQVVIPLLARNDFGGGAELLGWMMTAIGVGGLFGSMWASHSTRGDAPTLVKAAGALSVAMTAAALAPVLGAEFVGLVVYGAASMVVVTMASTVCIRATAPEYQGRVMSLIVLTFVGSTPIGGPLVGWISDVLGPRAAMGAGAAGSFVAFVMGFVGLRRLVALGAEVRPFPVERLALESVELATESSSLAG